MNPYKKIGLVRRFDASLRSWINTSTVNVAVGNTGGATVNYSLTLANNSYSNTCLLMVNYVDNDTTTNGAPRHLFLVIC